MKCKKTKLTALALSVLMAVSTISSVTWAADLFSDGSEEEGSVYESVEVSSDEAENTISEDIKPSDNEEMLSDNGNLVGIVIPEWDGTNQDEVDIISLSADGIYTMTVTPIYEDPVTGARTKRPDLPMTIHPTYAGITEQANCQHPLRDKLEWKDGNLNYPEIWYYHFDNWDAEKEKLHSDTTDYLFVSSLVSSNALNDVDKVFENGVFGGTPEIENGEDGKSYYVTKFKNADCESAGYARKYKYCKYCGSFYNFKTNQWDPKVNLPSLLQNSVLSYYKSFTETDNYGEYLIEEYVPALGHKEGNLEKDVVPPADTSYNSYDLDKDGNADDYKLDSDNPSKVVREWFEDQANCKKGANGFLGIMDPARDAYYYEFVRCSRCGDTLSIRKVYINNTNITEDGRYYKKGENVYGLLTTKGQILDMVPETEFKSAVLHNCEIGGTYYLVSYSKGFDGAGGYNESIIDTINVPAGHNWGKPYATVHPDGSSDAFNPETDKNGIVYKEGKMQISSNDVKQDENGEWVVYSKTCDNSKAFYEITQHCLNPNCKYASGRLSNPNLAGKRQAKPGGHVWYSVNDTDAKGKPRRYVDPSATVRKYIDEKHHLEMYKDHVECKICHTTSTIDSDTPDALVEHKFASKEIKGDDKKEANCGETGYLYRAQTCNCLTDLNDPDSYYYDKSTRTKVTIPATDAHVFGDNPVQIVWSGGTDGNGAVYIADRFVPGVSIHADIVRECTICHQLDSNGINTMLPKSDVGADVEIKGGEFDLGGAGDVNLNGKVDDAERADSTHYDYTTLVPAGKWCATPRVRDLEPAKTDPATGIAYRCSTAHATIYVDWVGTVDGKLVKLNEDEVDNAVKYNVPYYASAAEYAARTSHTPGKPQKEGDQIVTRCTVCGDIVSQDDDNTPNVAVPTVSAASVDFDTVNVSWTKVEGATAYRLYYRSSDEGISKWAKIRTFTGDTTSFAVNGLTTGSKYRFTVRAEVTQDGKTTLGDYSKKGAVAVPKLTAPEIKSVTASSKTTKVTWSRVDGASGYIVFRNSQRVGTVIKGSKLTWTDKKPVTGAKYQVRAYRTEDKKNYKSDLSEPK